MRKSALIVLLLLFASIVFADQTLPKGELADPVPSAYDPKQTHALYVPSTYTPEKKWPILFCYEARSRGRLPVELFREAAERLGWIIFSSNHSRSDDPNAKNLEVLNAMWSDSHKWFSLDEQRIYATGFSGGARLAWGMGYVYPKSIAGVIGVGAGAHFEKPPSKDTPFVWYGIGGNKDFNFVEMVQLDQQLAALQIPHRVDFFSGYHEWPPAEHCGRALDWMELQAMRKERRARDAEWIQQQYQQRVQEAVKLESTSNLFEAYLKYTHLKEDFEGLVDLGDAPVKLSKWAASDVIKKELKEQKKREEKELKNLHSFHQILSGFRNASEVPTLRRLKGDLKISQFQNEAKQKGDTEEGRLSQRLLETIFVQTSFYLPQSLLEKKEFDRAVLSLSVAAEIHPEYPWVWYNIAIAHIQDGNKKKALENLQIALDRGFKNRESIDEEKAFEPIRNDPAFQQLISKIPPQ